jgi:uncharacterized membrane protein
MTSLRIQRIVAREWLFLLAGFLLGMIVVPVAVGVFHGWAADAYAEFYGKFFRALFDDDEWWVAVLFALVPYFVFQLGRSIRWAIATVRGGPTAAE